MVKIIIDVTTTKDAEEQFEKYYSVFGNIVSAEMKFDERKNENDLILTNSKNEEMHILVGLTSGYIGTGSNGTCRVLRKAGFDIDDNLIYANNSFKIERDPCTNS